MPIWMKVTRRVATWSVFTSLDGTTWAAAGAPITLPLAGAWVELFVSADAGAATQPAQLQARFDHVSGFAPSVAVELQGPAAR